jgi:hypothetical protein
MIVNLNSISLEKQLNSIVQYSFGFLDGIHNGKSQFLNSLAKSSIDILGNYIDISARGNPRALHHVYEWYKTGSPEARLFDLSYAINSSRISINSSFKQSKSLSKNSKEPFYQKAKIMEVGSQITISPKSGSALRFEIDGEPVFTKNTVTIPNPGGVKVQGSFERVMDEFMNNYFKQSFLRSSGIFDYLENPMVYKQNLKAGSKGGRSVGISTGYKWIINAKIGVE